MEKARARTGCLVAVGSLLLVLIVAGVAAGVLWSRTRGNQRALLAQYEEISETSRARTYQRALAPPGWALEPCEAAERYQEAWSACDLEAMPDSAKDSLYDAQRAYTGDPTRAPGDAIQPLAAPGGKPIPTACLDAGIPDDAGDLVTAQLNADACKQYVACWSALDAVRRGTRCDDTASPVHLWASWSAVDGGPDYRSLLPFMQLSRMELLAGYVASRHGDAWAPAESSLTVLRYGHDLGQGSGLLGTMVGVAVQNQAADVLAHLLTTDALPAEDRERLVAELHYVNRHQFSIFEAVEAEYLTLGAIWVHEQLPVPPTAITTQGPVGLGEQMMMSQMADDHVVMGEELLPALDGSYPARIGAYEALMETMQDSWVMPDYSRYDTRLTATRARLLLLEIAAADGAFRAAEGRTPADLDELMAAYPGLPTLDPLTEESFILTEEQGKRLLRSRALGADGDPARLELIGTSFNVRAVLQLTLPDQVIP